MNSMPMDLLGAAYTCSVLVVDALQDGLPGTADPRARAFFNTVI